MTEHTRTILTIVAIDNGSNWYPDLVEQDMDDRDEFNFSVTSNLEEAIDLDEFEKDDHLRIFDAFSRAYEGDYSDVKLVKAEIKITLDDVVVEDEYADILKKRALEKLTPTEMNALGLQKMMTYIKLKFHKAA